MSIHNDIGSLIHIMRSFSVSLLFRFIASIEMETTEKKKTLPRVSGCYFRNCGYLITNI